MTEGEIGAVPGPAPAAPDATQAAADAALYARLVEDGFKGPDFDQVADSLARYAYPVLRAWLLSGQIEQKSAEKGGRGVGRATETRLALDEVEDLVQETVVAGLLRFIRDGRDGRGWSPHGGAALRTYFLGGCLLSYPDVRRSWERQQHRTGAPVVDLDAVRRHLSAGDPADLVAHRETIEEALPPPGRVRAAVLLAAEGYAHAEIARILEELHGEPVSPRAVEGLLYRHRKTWKGGGQP